jgi:hypothetical protein
MSYKPWGNAAFDWRGGCVIAFVLGMILLVIGIIGLFGTA